MRSLLRVGDIASCADFCDANLNCCSFEYSSRTQRCKLNRLCQPNQKKYPDYDFCVKPSVEDSVCPQAYTPEPGNVVGVGKLGYFSPVANIDLCARNCEDNNKCCSFEYSPSRMTCNLNSECGPTADGIEGQIFCVRRREVICPYFNYYHNFSTTEDITEVIDNVYSWQECGELENLNNGKSGKLA